MAEYSSVKLNLIAATSENNGIGKGKNLPWTVKNEEAYYASMCPPAQDDLKMNAIIMGRVTWDSIPLKYKPFTNRFTIVITKKPAVIQEKGPAGFKCVDSLDEAIKLIAKRNDIESTWVVGGAKIFKAAIEHVNCDKIYFTRIKKVYKCDKFFPEFSRTYFRHSGEHDVVVGDNHVEDGVEFETEIFKRVY